MFLQVFVHFPPSFHSVKQRGLIAASGQRRYTASKVEKVFWFDGRESPPHQSAKVLATLASRSHSHFGIADVKPRPPRSRTSR